MASAIAGDISTATAKAPAADKVRKSLEWGFIVLLSFAEELRFLYLLVEDIVKQVSGANGKPPAAPTARRFRIGAGEPVLLAALSVALFSLCAPGRPLPWLAWVAMVPLFVALHQARPLQGFLLSGLFGWLMWFTSVWWLQAPLRDMMGMSVAMATWIVLAGCLVIALPYAAAGAVVCKWRRRRGILGAGRDAAIFTAAITVLTPVFHGNIAHTQYQYPVILQILELGGAPLLLFLILWVNWILADAIVAFRAERRISGISLIAAAVIPAFVFCYGAVRLEQFNSAMNAAPPEQWLTVGAIQPNIPIRISDERQPDSGARENDFFTALEQARQLVERHPGIELIALPENPATFLFNQDAERRQALANFIRETGKSVLLNADAFDPAQPHGGRYNIAALIDSERNLAGHYPKIKRVPIVEYVPGEDRLPWLRKLFPKSLRVLEGPAPVVFDVKPGIHVIPLVCYEGTFSSFTREFVRLGGNVIVNQVNDSWFLRTPASEIHLALTLYRTVEYRMPLVRVTNSGISAHIRADGRIVPGTRTDLFTEAATVFPLFVPPQRSLYGRFGNLWMFALLAFLPGSRQRINPSSA